MSLQPTTNRFRARFPEFVEVSEATLQDVLCEAADQVGECWPEPDRTRGILYLTAHLLSLQGFGRGGFQAGTTGPVKRRRVGDVETEFSDATSAASGSLVLAGFNQTPYGQLYLNLVRKYAVTVFVV